MIIGAKCQRIEEEEVLLRVFLLSYVFWESSYQSFPIDLNVKDKQ